METLFYFFLLALLAEIIGTIGGFGSSLLFVPIASYFFDFHSVLGITALFHLASNVTKIYFFQKGFDKKLVVTIGLPAILFVGIGAIVSKYLPTNWLELCLSIFLISISLLFLESKKIVVAPTTSNSVLGGIASGFVAGLLGTGGAIRGLTLSAYHLPIATFIATSAIIDLGIDATRSIIYGYNGYIHREDLYLIPILIIVSIIGTYVGKKILLHISEEQFKKIVLVLILLTGISTLLKILL